MTDQVDGITETMEGQVQGNAEEADAERKAIMEDLENKFINMESDLKRLLNSVSAQNRNFRGIHHFEDSTIFGAIISEKWTLSRFFLRTRELYFRGLWPLFDEFPFFEPSIISRTRPFSEI